MAWNTLRTLVNRAGVAYDALKTSVIFAEDMNKIKDNLSYLKDNLNVHSCSVRLTSDQSLATEIFCRLELDYIISDLGSNYHIDDLYGAIGAFERADTSGCSATNIKLRSGGVPYPVHLMGAKVDWSSDAAGTLNVGSGYVTSSSSDPANLPITKFSGADFANGYYYHIRNMYYVAPVSGTYLIDASARVNSTELTKRYILCVDAEVIPAKITVGGYSAGPVLEVSSATTCHLNAGDHVYARFKAYSLVTPPCVMDSSNGETKYSIVCLKAD